MKTLGLRADDNGLELACRIAPDSPDALVGDPARLAQILVNLVGNATKFTDEGEVLLEIKTETQTDSQAVLHFSVKDTGIGISQEKLGTIFDAFTQADASTVRKHEGTGLGLAISSSLVKLMGGHIWVESEVGKGSTFHFAVAFQRATQTPSEVPVFGVPVVAREALEGTRVLIVDENATSREILEEMTRNWGMRPATVCDGDAAMDALRDAVETEDPYRLVVSDVGRPGMTGFSLVESMRQDSRLAKIPVILLTSGARAADVNRCEELAVAAHLMKPVKESEFLNTIGVSLGITTPGTARDDELRRRQWRTALPPLRVLLAEDSLVNQKVAIGILEKFGHSVTVAGSGKEAIAALATQKFDVVLMDVEMPDMDGLEATGHIRVKEEQTNEHIPIIAMTAHAMTGDRQRCLEAGMDGYVSKPVRVQQLLKTLESVLTSS